MQENELNHWIDMGSTVLKTLLKSMSEATEHVEKDVFGRTFTNGGCGHSADATGQCGQAYTSDSTASETVKPTILPEKFIHDAHALILKHQAFLFNSEDGRKLVSDVTDLMKQYSA